jgi:hypothetical protein
MCSRIKLRDNPSSWTTTTSECGPIVTKSESASYYVDSYVERMEDKLSEKHKTDPVFRKILFQSLSLYLKHQKRVEKKNPDKI